MVAPGSGSKQTSNGALDRALQAQDVRLISTGALAGLLPREGEDLAFDRPSQGPVTDIRGTVAPGLKEKKAERWSKFLGQTSKQARLGQNEQTLEGKEDPSDSAPPVFSPSKTRRAFLTQHRFLHPVHVPFHRAE